MPQRSRPSTGGCPSLDRKLKPGDIVILTADHGCDPTWRGTDHTRERVPVLAFGPGIRIPLDRRPAGLCRYRRNRRQTSRPRTGPAWEKFSVTAHLKKAELHCHIEGAAPPALASIQARKYNVDISGIIEDGAYVWADFSQFLEMLRQPSPNSSAPRRTMRCWPRPTCTELAEAGTIYSEIIVSPDHGNTIGIGARRLYPRSGRGHRGGQGKDRHRGRG